MAPGAHTFSTHLSWPYWSSMGDKLSEKAQLSCCTHKGCKYMPWVMGQDRDPCYGSDITVPNIHDLFLTTNPSAYSLKCPSVGFLRSQSYFCNLSYRSGTVSGPT
ncbi:hypothetical protein GWK47_039374 [Chionoecetes opilio]|uniref:Uncharacterized protein n=1 Tax=Chionoecetes opilio TaxID=41210 RepID=A0A8J5CLN3_CHIOP|nr:hypothetical protein GWK47_039374 [Chionoecetes opilio]